MCKCHHNLYACGHTLHIKTVKCSLELLGERAIVRPSDIEAAEDEYFTLWTPAAVAEVMRPDISRFHTYLDEMSYLAELCKECKKDEEEGKGVGAKKAKEKEKEKDVVKWRKERVVGRKVDE